MKKFLAVLFGVLLIVSSAMLLTACKDVEDEENQHACSYVLQVVSDEYIAKEASCHNPARYYYSCACGKGGTQTFESGEPLEHEIGSYEFMDLFFHIIRCKGGEIISVEACTYGSDGVTCIYCGAERDPHEHEFTIIKSTEEEHWYECECGQADDDVYAHDYSIVKHDYRGHWNECVCGRKESGEITLHDYKVDDDSVIKKENKTIDLTLVCTGCQSRENTTGYFVGEVIGMLCQEEGKEIYKYGLLGSNTYQGTYEITIPMTPHYVIDGVTLEDENVWTRHFLKDVSEYPITFITNLPSTCEEFGEAVFTCVECSYMIKIIVRGDHNFVDGECTTCGEEGESPFYTYQGVNYLSINNDTEYIVYSVSNKAQTNFIILSNVNNKPVTSIGASAFVNCDSLETIEIPSSVTSIGNFAFAGCEALQYINIPSSVNSIGRFALIYCDSLANINFNGTTAEWNGIEKGEYWNGNFPATYVQCSDGKVDLD